jgi:catechol 2,3-dioxygenase-like lactoylglutathione lyase family enzyme
MVLSLHHVAVIVRNVDEALKFYRGVFELPDRDRLTARVSSHRGAWFQLGALELHLQERSAGDSPKSEQHFALLTDKFDEIQRRVKDFGGRIEDAKFIEGVQKRCSVYDVDENRIELLQR